MSSEPDRRRNLVPLLAACGALAVIVVPLVAVNLSVESRGGDQPVRIANWFDSLESFAMFVMILTIGIVVILGLRRHQAAKRIVWMSLVQGTLVFFLAYPMMFFSRSGGLFGPSYIESSYNPNGTRGAHVYSTGFMECEFTVYESEGWAIRMHRVDVARGCSKPKISWDDEGKLQVGRR